MSSSAAQFKSVRFLDELALTHSKDFFVSPEEGKTPNPPVHFPEHQCLQYWFRMIREEKMAPSPRGSESAERNANSQRKIFVILSNDCQPLSAGEVLEKVDGSAYRHQTRAYWGVVYVVSLCRHHPVFWQLIGILSSLSSLSAPTLASAGGLQLALSRFPLKNDSECALSSHLYLLLIHN